MKLPDCSPEVLHKIGLALEQGQDEVEMRETIGDETVDWLNEAMQTPEYKEWSLATTIKWGYMEYIVNSNPDEDGQFGIIDKNGRFVCTAMTCDDDQVRPSIMVSDDVEGDGRYIKWVIDADLFERTWVIV